ncbi:MAG: efflux RND transporter periplasmic adaptor subunit [Hamadaea sp.]|nr:efflux RND transporter periplasmic adaptor subunit [Hamadaea sp.]
MSRLSWANTAGGAVTAAVAVAAVFGFGGRAPEAADATGPAATTAVVRQTLADAKTITGELGHGEALPLTSRAAGTLTWLPAVGATVSRGKPLLRADEQPIVLLYGPLPAYRPLATGVEGPDVKQFEQNLKALGYSGFTVDQDFSAATAAAVKRWQDDLGVPETGMVDPGAVVYAAGPLRVEEHQVRVGAPAAGDLYTFTGTRKVVSLRLPADDHAWAAPGTAVTVTLPGGVTVPGKIDKVGTEASADEESQNQGPDAATVPVTVALADQAKLGDLTKSPVEVRYVAQERKDVLTVPVAALLALAEGGYGLELVTPEGSRTIAVEVGLFADGRVEVRGAGLAEGQTVGMPS